MRQCLSRLWRTGFSEQCGTECCSASRGWHFEHTRGAGAQHESRPALHHHVCPEYINRSCARAALHLAQCQHRRTRRGVGVLVWIGFLGPVTYTTYMYEMRPKELFAINQFYPLVGCV